MMRKITQPLHIMKAEPSFRHSRPLLNLLLKWRHLYRLLERSPCNQGALYPPDSLVQTNEDADNSNTPDKPAISKRFCRLIIFEESVEEQVENRP